MSTKTSFDVASASHFYIATKVSGQARDTRVLRHMLRSFAVAVMVICIPKLSLANDGALNIVRIIDGLGSISSVEIAIVPDSIAMATQLTPETLESSGCKFLSLRPSVANSFATLLKNAEFELSDHSPYWDMRQAIILRSQRHGDFKVFLGATWRGYWGQIENVPGVGRRQVVAKRSLLQDIYELVKQAEYLPAPNGDAAIDAVCRDIVK